ncbi:MarR family winged helix-turn-helix transcriptional regulator [Microbacterium sp. GXF7504]
MNGPTAVDAATSTRLNEAVCLALYSTTHATLQLYRDLLAPWGLSYQQLMVLGLLWEAGEQTPGAIADALWLDSSSVAGLLRRMEQRELIVRDVDPDDRRRVRVAPTERSEAIRAEIGWLEDCLTQALDLDEAAARDLVTRLRGIRDRIAAFDRPDPGALDPTTA